MHIWNLRIGFTTPKKITLIQVKKIYELTIDVIKDNSP